MTTPAPSLWNWSAAAYDRPGIKEKLLALQDAYDADVCLVLWRAWLAAHGGTPSTELAEQAARLSVAWRRAVVLPLRAARDALKAPPPEIGATAAGALRRDVLTAELSAERLQLEALEAMSEPAFAQTGEGPVDSLSLVGVPAQLPSAELSSLIKELAAL